MLFRIPREREREGRKREGNRKEGMARGKMIIPSLVGK